MSGDFSPEQKALSRGLHLGPCRSRAPGAASAAAASRGAGADRARRGASRRAGSHRRAGGKLNDQEKFKREQHPFDAYERLNEQAASNEPPKPADNFRWRYYGLFYVAPAQNRYMCRLRMPNGILKHWQMSGLADLAERLRRRLLARHDARQPANPRYRAEERRRA